MATSLPQHQLLIKKVRESNIYNNDYWKTTTTFLKNLRIICPAFWTTSILNNKASVSYQKGPRFQFRIQHLKYRAVNFAICFTLGRPNIVNRNIQITPQASREPPFWEALGKPP